MNYVIHANDPEMRCLHVTCVQKRSGWRGETTYRASVYPLLKPILGRHLLHLVGIRDERWWGQPRVPERVPEAVE
jgi:hypothetical protein